MYSIIISDKVGYDCYYRHINGCVYAEQEASYYVDNMNAVYEKLSAKIFVHHQQLENISVVAASKISVENRFRSSLTPEERAMYLADYQDPTWIYEELKELI
jgi:hypothetical protein